MGNDPSLFSLSTYHVNTVIHFQRFNSFREELCFVESPLPTTTRYYSFCDHHPNNLLTPLCIVLLFVAWGCWRREQGDMGLIIPLWPVVVMFTSDPLTSMTSEQNVCYIWSGSKGVQIFTGYFSFLIVREYIILYNILHSFKRMYVSGI